MNAASRLARELALLAKCLAPLDFARYLGAAALSAPAVLRTRSLAPADRKMKGEVRVKSHHQEILVPLDEMTTAMAARDDTPTFGSIREMYAADVYLQAFEYEITARTVLDLGSNRGMFLMLAAKGLTAELAIGVEPQTFYEPVFDALVNANRPLQTKFERISRLAASRDGPDSISMASIIAQHGIDRIDFLKCDIEGGEFDVFLKNNEFLTRVDNIAMELHSEAGDPASLSDALIAQGFKVVVTDQFGARVVPATGHYLYASRTGRLKDPT